MRNISCPWGVAGDRVCPARAVLCRRPDAYLQRLRKREEARTHLEAVHPFRPCESCGHLRLGANDGSVQNRVGHDFRRYESRKLRLGTKYCLAVGDCDSHGRLQLFREHPSLGGQDGVGLYRGIGVQYARPCRCGQDGRPCCKGNDGFVKILYPVDFIA